ncbi:MAG: PTS sugar transporter subunit IIB [bacterium]|nr:PTS sugar transporter subunit IIB [bacterium]
MKILRIDDRLIHGQVIVGWVKKLGLDAIVLLHSDLDADIIELYRSMLEQEVCFLSADLRKDSLPVKQNSIYVSGSVNELFENRDQLKNAEFDLFNFGGLRTKESKIKLLDFIYMDKQEMQNSLELASFLNVRSNAQELPESENFNIIKIIKEHL